MVRHGDQQACLRHHDRTRDDHGLQKTEADFLMASQKDKLTKACWPVSFENSANRDLPGLGHVLHGFPQLSTFIGKQSWRFTQRVPNKKSDNGACGDDGNVHAPAVGGMVSQANTEAFMVPEPNPALM